MDDPRIGQAHAVERSNDKGHDRDEAEIMAPIILSLGKKKNKQIKQLKRGKGRAMDEVIDVIEQVEANLGDQAAGKILVPIVVIYGKKQRRLRGWL